MTIYRRRLASSFHALIRTLEGRLAAVGGQTANGLAQGPSPATEEDVPDDELAEEAMDADQALDLEQQALALEEMGDIRALLAAAKRLPARHQGRGPAGGPDRAARAGLPPGDGLHPVHRHHGLPARADQRRLRSRGDLLLRAGRRGADPGRRLAGDLPRGDQAALPGGPCRDHGLHGCGGRGPQLPVLRRPGELRHALEPHAGRAAHRAHRPPGPGAPRDPHRQPALRRTRWRRMFTPPCATASTCSQSFVGRLQPILARLPRAITEVALGRPGDRELARANLVSDIASRWRPPSRPGSTWTR